MIKNNELMPCPFERGQVWKNPDDKLMMVTSIKPHPYGKYRVDYVTDDGETGTFFDNDLEIINNCVRADRAAPSPVGDVKSEWVKCPICGESDMRMTRDRHDPQYTLINCVNHGCPSNNITFTQAPAPKAAEDVIAPIVPIKRRKFDGSNNFVEVYTTKEKEVFLSIGNQTFQFNSWNDEDNESYCHSEWMASQICHGINRLIEKCAHSLLDNRPMTERLSRPFPEPIRPTPTPPSNAALEAVDKLLGSAKSNDDNKFRYFDKLEALAETIKTALRNTETKE